MYQSNSTTPLASPRPQYPPQFGESSKAQAAQQRRTELHTPFREASMATPFSDITSDSSEASLAGELDDGRYSRNDERAFLPGLDLDLHKTGLPQNSSARVQLHAEKERAAHIAREEAKTSRTNPYADPPVVRRAHAPWVGAGVRMQYGWERDFRSAASTKDMHVRRKFAEEIVAAGAWKEGTREVQALAGMLVERAAEGDAQGTVSVAPLARSLHNVFKDKGEQLAALFHAQLKWCALEEFEAWWQPGKPTALSSFKYKGKSDALTAAFAIVTLIADLHTANLVPPEMVIVCLHTLVRNMFAVEQARAARIMLSRVDLRIKEADTAAIQATLVALFINTAQISTSFVGEFKQTDATVQIKEVEAICERWSRVEEIYALGGKSMTASENDKTPQQPSFPVLAPTAIWQPAPKNTPVLSQSISPRNPPA